MRLSVSTAGRLLGSNSVSGRENAVPAQPSPTNGNDFTDSGTTMSVPAHVAIIMDGNGRWAAQRGLARIKGHKAGVRAVEAILDEASDLGIGHLSLYAFSTENWKRPAFEVTALMALLRMYLR